MEVTTILDIRTIKTNMIAKDKADAITQLSTLLFDQEYITNIDIFEADIYSREAEGQTGIGNFIAIPHGRSTAVKKIGVAIGVLKEEIEWETLDGKGVRAIILFAVGNDSDAVKDHLKVLSLFARKLGNDQIIEHLLNAKSAEMVVKAFE